METTLKKEVIELPVEVMKRLADMAKANKKSLKAYIESILVGKAESELNPSPSGDKWFEDPENIKIIQQGVKELNEGKLIKYSINEIKSILDV